MYEIGHVDNQAWETFVLSQEFTPFVQSSRYGQFYERMGERYWILGIFTEGELVGGSLVLSTHARRGNFLYLPYGPILDYSNPTMLRMFVEALRDLAKSSQYDFIRISPLLDDKAAVRKAIQEQGFRVSPMHVLAENSWILDLRPDERALLTNMKKNHRNLVRRCSKATVDMSISTSLAALDQLNEMLDETEKKHNFTRFSRKYIENEFASFVGDNMVQIFSARLPDGRLDAAAVVVFYGNMAVYRHSASLNLDKRLPTSYLIQWHSIQEAKKRGMMWYNFWGVEPKGAPKDHPFAGLGHFKRGFGGFQKDLLRCHDLPVTKKYWFNWMVETIRRKKRGF